MAEKLVIYARANVWHDGVHYADGDRMDAEVDDVMQALEEGDAEVEFEAIPDEKVADVPKAAPQPEPAAQEETEAAPKKPSAPKTQKTTRK